MQNITISVSGVSKQLLKLNPGKAAGPDNISPRILKELHNEIAPILTDIFNTSLSEGIVPVYLLQSLRTYYHLKYYVISRPKQSSISQPAWV